MSTKVGECERKMKKNEGNHVLPDCVNIQHDKMSQCQQTSVGNKRTKKILFWSKVGKKNKRCAIRLMTKDIYWIGAFYINWQWKSSERNVKN